MERYNDEHYRDETPKKAIEKVEREKERLRQARVGDAVHTMKHIAEMKGFEVVERIVMRDSKTGKIYR